MENEIVEGQENCCLDIKPKCTGASCVLFITFSDQKKGLCAFQIGRAAVRIVPGIVNELSGVLKNEMVRKQLSEGLKKVIASLSILLLLVIAQFSYAANSVDTWENNRKYIGDKLDTLTKEIQALRVDIKTSTDNSAKQDSNISSQDVKITTLQKNVDYLQDNIKYLYGLLILSVGGNAVSGGALWRQTKNNKKLPLDSV